MSKIYVTYSTPKGIDIFDNQESIRVVTNNDYLESRLRINKFKSGKLDGDLILLLKTVNLKVDIKIW